jgi:mxaJ protein
MVYGDYRDRTPQSAIVDAVARGDVDVAVAWGPTAGYFASRAPVPMAVVPVRPWLDGPQSPMVFDISMGVRRDDRELRRRLDEALAKEAPAIRRLLADYGVPLLDDVEGDAAGEGDAPAWSSTTTSPRPGR